MDNDTILSVTDSLRKFLVCVKSGVGNPAHKHSLKSTLFVPWIFFPELRGSFIELLLTVQWTLIVVSVSEETYVPFLRELIPWCR